MMSHYATRNENPAPRSPSRMRNPASDGERGPHRGPKARTRLMQSGERDGDGSLTGRSLPPLHQNRALVRALDHTAVSSVVEIRHQQTDRTFHAQEAAGRQTDDARSDPLDERLADVKRVAHLIEGADEIVFRVVDGFGWDRPRIG